MDLVHLLLPLIRNLDRPDGNRADLVRLERERDEWRKNFENARDHASNLDKRNRELTTDLDALKHAFAIERDQLHETIAQRDEKVSRMVNSLSWKITMPYRAVRRLLLPRKPERSDAPPATGLSPSRPRKKMHPASDDSPTG